MIEINPPPLESNIVNENRNQPPIFTPVWQRWLARIYEKFREIDEEEVGGFPPSYRLVTDSSSFPGTDVNVVEADRGGVIMVHPAVAQQTNMQLPTASTVGAGFFVIIGHHTGDGAVEVETDGTDQILGQGTSETLQTNEVSAYISVQDRNAGWAWQRLFNVT